MEELAPVHIVAKKLKGYFAERGMTQKQIADQLGIRQQNVGQLLLGKRPFGNITAIKWNKEFGFSIHWLLTGEGEMFETSENIFKDGGLIPVIPKKILRKPDVDIYEFALTSGKITQCLPTIPIFPEFELYYECASQSMIPEILPGDLLAIRRIDEEHPLINGESYVIDTRSCGMLIRMLENKGDTVLASAHNERYKPILFDKEDVISISSIVGLLRIKG